MLKMMRSVNSLQGALTKSNPANPKIALFAPTSGVAMSDWMPCGASLFREPSSMALMSVNRKSRPDRMLALNSTRSARLHACCPPISDLMPSAHHSCVLVHMEDFPGSQNR